MIIIATIIKNISNILETLAKGHSIHHCVGSNKQLLQRVRPSGPELLDDENDETQNRVYIVPHDLKMPSSNKIKNKNNKKNPINKKVSHMVKMIKLIEYNKSQVELLSSYECK